jgi:hypothetical protein
LRVRAAVNALGDRRYTVFLRGTKLPFIAKVLNLNRPDWDKGSLMFLVDPGAGNRDEWACRMSRPEWVVIGWDPDLETEAEEFGSAKVCPPLTAP